MKLTIDIPDKTYDKVVNDKYAIYDEMYNAIANGTPYEERPQDEWIPIRTRKPTEEEKEEDPDIDFIYDCSLPDDGEKVLVTTSCDDVALDVFCRDGDYGCYFEYYCDEDDVLAWQPLPKPYKEKEQ